MIDNISIQRALAAKGLYKGALDGVIGGASNSAIGSALATAAVKGIIKRPIGAWSAQRRRLAFEQLMMTEAGIDVGEIDGVEGVSTQYGWDVWQNRLRKAETPSPLVNSPKAPVSAGKSQWPDQDDAEKFYGKPGTGLVRVTPPYQLYYGGDPVKTITLNEKCAESALKAMNSVLACYGDVKIHALGIDIYGGSFNDRPMRGGTRKSMHAYGCAIDFDPVRNALRADHRTAQFAKPEYAAFLDAWEAEGWTSLGRASDRDWMHVQAARL